MQRRRDDPAELVCEARNVQGGRRQVSLAGRALLAIIARTAAGCQQRSAPAAPPTAEVDHAAAGHRAFEPRDWGTAASLYRVAIQKSPDDLLLHYRLAIASSWLDRRDEAMTEFEWVVAHAAVTSDEARVARDWLAGARSRSAARAGAAVPDTAVTERRVGEHGVHGRIVWDEGQGTQPLKRAPVHLYAPGEARTPQRISLHVR